MALGPKQDGGRLAAEARELRAMGLNYNQIAKRIGVGPETVHRWLDPAYAAQRKTQINVARRLREEAGR